MILDVWKGLLLVLMFMLERNCVAIVRSRLEIIPKCWVHFEAAARLTPILANQPIAERLLPPPRISIVASPPSLASINNEVNSSINTIEQRQKRFAAVLSGWRRL